MLLASLLLFTGAEFLQFLKDNWFLISTLGAALLAQYKAFMGRLDHDKQELAGKITELGNKLESSREADKQELVGLVNTVKNEAGNERKDLFKRVAEVEDVDKRALPTFEKLLAKFDALDEKVNRTHEIRLDKLQTELDKQNVHNEQRFVFTENKILDLDKKLDNLTNLINRNYDVAEKNHDKLMDQILKMKGN